MRQALELSIDRAALNQVVFDGMYEPGNQWVSPGNPYYIKSLPIPSRDVAKAKQLLAAANAPHPVVKLMAPNNPEIMRAAEVIQAMAAEAGFDIRIEATEFATSLDLAAKGDFEAYLIGWSGRTDPDGNIYNFVACEAPPALNAARYCNPEVDRELEAARAIDESGGAPRALCEGRGARACRPADDLFMASEMALCDEQTGGRVQPLPRRANPAAGIADRVRLLSGGDAGTEWEPGCCGGSR